MGPISANQMDTQIAAWRRHPLSACACRMIKRDDTSEEFRDGNETKGDL